MSKDKHIRVRAVLVIRSQFKELETHKGVRFCNVLACPQVGPALRLNFYGLSFGELRVLVGSKLEEGSKVEIIGRMTGTYDEKPDITVRYFRVLGGDSWLELLV